MSRYEDALERILLAVMQQPNIGLRDYLAAHALPLTTADCDRAHGVDENGCDAKAHAIAAYRIADAMIEARTPTKATP